MPPQAAHKEAVLQALCSRTFASHHFVLRQFQVRPSPEPQAAHKEAVLLALCSRTFASGRTIVFFQTKQKAHRLKILFGLAGLPPAAELHGDMTQAARLESLERFRKVG
jgi:ATP-dependent RNA helicase DDX27